MNNKQIAVLVACEESQTVCKAFLNAGFDAYSNDVQGPSGGLPERHLQMDCFEALKLKPWRLIIMHPPCTHTCISGNAHHAGTPEREQGAAFTANLWNAAKATGAFCALEQPKTIMGRYIGKHTQAIQPYEYGHPEIKETWLWLHGLPKLEPTKFADFKNYVCKCGYIFSETYGKYGCANCGGSYGAARPLWDNMTPSGQNKLGPSEMRGRIRSKTYKGIAEAMAKQWGDYILI